MRKIIILIIILIVGCNPLNQIDCKTNPNQKYCHCDKSKYQDMIGMFQRDLEQAKERCSKTVYNNSWCIENNLSLVEFHLMIESCDDEIYYTYRQIHAYRINDECLEAHEMNETEKRELDEWLNQSTTLTFMATNSSGTSLTTDGYYYLNKTNK